MTQAQAPNAVERALYAFTDAMRTSAELEKSPDELLALLPPDTLEHLKGGIAAALRTAPTPERLPGYVRAVGERVMKSLDNSSPTPSEGVVEQAVRLALEDADALERIADEADENRWMDWGALMRQASMRIRTLAAHDTAQQAKIAALKEGVVAIRDDANFGVNDADQALALIHARARALLDQEPSNAAR